ncbi:hypothetical protein [Flavobacterium sp.]|jgi:hypothetical protein|uniref:hypothetical protein n=1 Tax=Flavobacterium sp. TaxID=239 RepID=UPI0037BFBA26
MFQFCFNDCIPNDGTNDMLVNHLSTTLTHYDQIKNKFPSNIDGIITDRYPTKLILNNIDFSLANCIEQLNRELKKIALINFNKYPLEYYFTITDEDNLIKGEFSIDINKISYDGINAKIVEENEGILFSLPVHNDLKKNKLTISNNQNEKYNVLNQYGDDSNTEFILDLINADLIQSKEGFQKLIAIIGNCIYNERFQREFENLPSSTQKKVLDHTVQSINRKEKTRFYPDDKIIKDVTPNKEADIKVFEMRVFNPLALRIYFYEAEEKVYFGGIEKKPKKKVQNLDILNAASVIKELIITKG